jgi:hypothetical protein
MTLSTSPTFICKDLSGSPFALTLRIPASLVKEEVQGGGYDVSSFKKGFTFVVPGARRSGVSEGKQGFVEIPAEEVKVSHVCGVTGKGTNETGLGDSW